jgi:hypothetical protein
VRPHSISKSTVPSSVNHRKAIAVGLCWMTLRSSSPIRPESRPQPATKEDTYAFGQSGESRFGGWTRQLIGFIAFAPDTGMYKPERIVTILITTDLPMMADRFDARSSTRAFSTRDVSRGGCHGR